MRIATECPCCGSDHLDQSPAILMPFVAERIFQWQPVKVMPAWGLTTIPEGTHYTPCNTLACRECGLSFLDMRFSDEELARLYHDYRGEAYLERRLFYEPGYAGRHERELTPVRFMPDIEKFIRPWTPSRPAILDWGGDTGKNAPFADERRFLHVFDVSDVPLIEGAVKIENPQPVYDLIVCAAVLEHLPYPRQELERIARIMRRDTILYLQIPDEFTGKPLDQHYWHEHVQRFTRESIRRAVESCGMEVRASDCLCDEFEGRKLWMLHFICTLRTV